MLLTKTSKGYFRKEIIKSGIKTQEINYIINNIFTQKQISKSFYTKT